MDGGVLFLGTSFTGTVPQPPAGSSRRPRAAAPPISPPRLLLPGGVVSLLKWLPSIIAPSVCTCGADRAENVARAYPTVPGGRPL